MVVAICIPDSARFLPLSRLFSSLPFSRKLALLPKPARGRPACPVSTLASPLTIVGRFSPWRSRHILFGCGDERGIILVLAADSGATGVQLPCMWAGGRAACGSWQLLRGCMRDRGRVAHIRIHALFSHVVYVNCRRRLSVVAQKL